MSAETVGERPHPGLSSNHDIEIAARAIGRIYLGDDIDSPSLRWDADTGAMAQQSWPAWQDYIQEAQAVLEAAAPLIQAAALRKASAEMNCAYAAGTMYDPPVDWLNNRADIIEKGGS